MSLFEEQKTPVFTDLVGEDKKYKTPDDAAKAIIEKDRFIEQLKTETAQLRTELTTKTSVVDRSQEILDRLEALKKPQEPSHETVIPIQEPERTEAKGISLDDVERVLTEREKKMKAINNIEMVKQELKKVYGDKYSAALNTMAEKNGLSQDTLTDLAAKSPQLVLNLMTQPGSKETFVTPPDPSVSTSFTPSAGGAQPKSYYDKLKATDKVKYFSPAIQNQMYKDAMKLQEAFYDT